MKIMINRLLAVIGLLWPIAVGAQSDPVLMRINGKEIFRSEFEQACKADKALAEAWQQHPKHGVQQFIDYKLKVLEAEAKGLDTVQTFSDSLDTYRRRLSIPYLTDKETLERAARWHYDHLMAGRRGEKLRVGQIFNYLPQNVSSYTLNRVKARMDSIYSVLWREGGDSLFEECVERFSDEKEPLWLSRLQVPAEFEEVAWGMQPGGISRPFFTPQGIHIVKVIERREAPSFDEAKAGIMRLLLHRCGMDEGVEVMVEKLKKEYGYATDPDGIKELLLKGGTERTLFVLDGVAYTGKEFARFAAIHPSGVRQQLKDFTSKVVLDYENSRLEQKYPDFRLMMQAYKEQLLLREAYRHEVVEHSRDTAGLKDYFDNHRTDYHWKEPRYKGIVLHCATKRMVKQVRKLLKQLPEEEWADAVRLTFNAGDVKLVQAEQALFARGDNAYVDELVFKGEDAVPIPSFPFTAVLGRKLKGPEDYSEVGGRLQADYRGMLERQWTERLRASAKVEINQEVLKTVNNH